jgi:dTDP-glucose 4,6-dehydratase
MIINALNGKALPVYGDGRQVRDWLHVDDHCAAIARVLDRGRVGEVYNIGGNNEWMNIDIVRLLLRTMGKPESLITYVTDRPGHDRRYAIDAGKITSELGWEPAITFEQGLPGTIDWYLSHESWWQRIISGAYQEYYKEMYEHR